MFLVASKFIYDNKSYTTTHVSETQKARGQRPKTARIDTKQILQERQIFKRKAATDDNDTSKSESSRMSVESQSEPGSSKH
jgi:hypothetical protein